MQLLSTLVFVAAAVASVAAQTRDCTTAESTTAFTALAPLLSGTDLAPCASDSGYDMLNAKSLPTDAEYKKMCGLATCKGLIKSVLATNPPNCILLIPTSQAKLNVNELANGFDGVCTRLGVTSGGSTASNSTAPAAGGASNSTAPSTSTASNSTSAATAAPATTKPAAATTTAPTTAPTPAPTSAAGINHSVALGVATVAALVCFSS